MMRSLGSKTTRRAYSLGYRIRGSANLDFAIGNELIGRHHQISGRGSLANTAGRVVLRTVAREKEAVVMALIGDRNTAKVGADADHDQPLVVAFLDPGLIRRRIGKARDRH